MRQMMNMQTILRERDLTTLQRSIIARMKSGNKLYRQSGRIWLDCAFEAVLPSRTFFALRVKDLIRRANYGGRAMAEDLHRIAEGKTPADPKIVTYELTAKGREWATMDWKP